MSGGWRGRRLGDRGGDADQLEFTEGFPTPGLLLT
jgi:hypothetical protein